MFLDIIKQVRTNNNFLSRVKHAVSKIEKLQQSTDPQALELQQAELFHLLGECGFNVGFMVPYYFPAYPQDQPLSLLSRPFAFSFLNLNIYGTTVYRGSRQIGKSLSMIARQRILAHLLPKFSSLYIVPHQEHLKTYANKFREMEMAFRYSRVPQRFRQNLHFKEYPNGSKVELMRLLTSTADVRGKTVDELLYDEFQLFDISFLEDIEQTQKASKIPMTIFSGTSTTVESPLEAKFQESSQGCWHVRSPDGRHWINCGDPEQVCSIFKPDGPTCPYTTRPLDMRNGEFVNAFNDRFKAGYVGYHVPQILVPEYVENQENWLTLYKAFKGYQRPKFLQEILGIPTEEGAREITLADLQNICKPEMGPDALLSLAQRKQFKFIVSGCDWGGSDYNQVLKTKLSYTCHAIVGMRHDNSIVILHGSRYAGMDYRTIINLIVQDHKKWCGGSIASDFGAGQAYNMLIREHPDVPHGKHLIFNYTAPGTALLSQQEDGTGLYNQFSLNKSESITLLFQMLKSGRIHTTSWDVMGDFLNDILNVYRIPMEHDYGRTRFRWQRHGSKADDFLHALNFAIVLLRILNGEDLLPDKTLVSMIQNVLSGRASRGGIGGFSGLGRIPIISG